MYLIKKQKCVENLCAYGCFGVCFIDMLYKVVCGILVSEVPCVCLYFHKKDGLLNLKVECPMKICLFLKLSTVNKRFYLFLDLFFFELQACFTLDVQMY